MPKSKTSNSKITTTKATNKAVNKVTKKTNKEKVDSSQKLEEGYADNSLKKINEPSLPKPKQASRVSFIRRVVQVCLIMAIFISGYILFLQFTPQKKVLTNRQQDLFVASVPISATNKLVIPKIAVNSPIVEGDYQALEKGVWHRFPERGNPRDGGNFILAAHRYVFAWLPQRVNEQSVLYNIDKLNVGDTIYVDWQNKRYTYAISEKRRVEPSESSIEDPLNDQNKNGKLTLYSCTLSGERDGREVVIAHRQD